MPQNYFMQHYKFYISYFNLLTNYQYTHQSVVIVIRLSVALSVWGSFLVLII